MKHRIVIVAVAGLLAVCAAALLVYAAEDDAFPAGSAKWQRPADWDEIVADRAKLDAYRCPPPSEFAIVFSFGYTGDFSPKDDAKFEELLVKVKAAGFNVIHTSYTANRVELCRKHDMKLMIDFLDTENHHIWRLKDKCEAVARAVEGDPAVWGYNIWNDHFGDREEGRERDIRTVREWDPSHPSYCGGCSNDDDRALTNADMAGYYDFHWERGIDLHFPHLIRFLDAAHEYNNSYMALISGRPTNRHGAARDYYHRSRWTVHTSIACGSKGFSWFLAPMDRDTLEWTADAGHITPVNLEVYPMRRELMKIGLPAAVYATKVTRGWENQELGEPSVVRGLEKNGFPEDFWIQPVSGEIVMGVFRYADGAEAIYVANLNSQADQDVQLKINKGVVTGMFDRESGEFKPLEIKDGEIGFTLGAGGGELIRFDPIAIP